LKDLVARIKLDGKDFISDMTSGKNAALAFSASIGVAVAGVAALTIKTANTIEANTKLARSAGELVDRYSALAFAAKLGGVESETLAAGMAKMAKPEQRKNLEALGIALLDVNGKMRSQTDLMLDLSSIIQKTEDPLKRLQIAQLALGKSGGQYLEFLKEGPDGIRKLMEEAKALGQVFSENDAAAADLFNDRLDTLKAGIEGVGNVVGKSIIQWVNQSEAMELAIDAAKGVIAAWEDLDDSTKDFVFTFGAAVVVIGLVAGAIYGLVTLLPILASAMNAAFVTNPIGAVLVLLALVSASIIYMHNNWEDFIEFFRPAIKTFQDFKTVATGAFSSFSNLVGGLGDKLAPTKDVFGNIAKAFENVDLVATGLKYTIAPLLVAFYTLATIIRILSINFKAFIDLINSPFGQGLLDFIAASTTSNIVGMGLAVDKMAKNWDSAKGIITGAISESRTALGNLSTDVAKTMSNIVTKTKPAAEALANITPPSSEDDLNKKAAEVVKVNNQFVTLYENITNAGAAFSKAFGEGDFKKKMQAYAEGIEAMEGAVEAIGSQIANLFSAQAAVANTRLNNFKQDNQFMLGAINFFADQELELAQAGLDREIEALQSQKDALLQEETDYQENLKAIKDAYSETRRAELDKELEEEFGRLDALYEKQVQILEAGGLKGMDLEAKKAGLLAENEDKKNQLIAQSEKRLQKDIEKKNKDLEEDGKKKANDRKKREDDLAAHIQMLEEQKEAAAEQAANKKAQLDKMVKLQEWSAGKAAFEIGKKAQMVQIGTSMAMGVLNAVQAGVLLAASIPVVGWVLGPILAATLSGLVLAAGSSAMSSVAGQQYPPPPLFDDGGISTGSASGNGWRSEDAEMHIPMSNPGKDFGALKAEVAKELVGGERRNGVRIEKVEINNHFDPRDDYEEIKSRLNQDLGEMVRTALES